MTTPITARAIAVIGEEPTLHLRVQRAIMAPSFMATVSFFMVV
jgi:hypothetical protein